MLILNSKQDDRIKGFITVTTPRLLVIYYSLSNYILRSIIQKSDAFIGVVKSVARSGHGSLLFRPWSWPSSSTGSTLPTPPPRPAPTHAPHYTNTTHADNSTARTHVSLEEWARPFCMSLMYFLYIPHSSSWQRLRARDTIANYFFLGRHDCTSEGPWE